MPRIETRRSVQPLFSGYTFVLIIDRWRAIETTIGVLCLVKFGDAPARVPDREIEALRRRADEHGLIRLPAKPPSVPKHVFRKGEKVRIIGGPFEGVRAIHSGMRAGDRERILLSLLGSPSRPVMVPSHQVAAAQ